MKTIRKKYYKRRRKKSILVEFVIALTLITVVVVGAKELALPNESIEGIQLIGCVDGDTAKLKINGQSETVRFLAIDTPETKHPSKGVEPYGKEASNYTCEALENASVIRIEYDSNSETRDKYNRVLAWVFVDEKLLQEELLKNGLGKVAYLYGNYSYLDKLSEAEKYAQSNSLGIWK